MSLEEGWLHVRKKHQLMRQEEDLKLHQQQIVYGEPLSMHAAIIAIEVPQICIRVAALMNSSIFTKYWLQKQDTNQTVKIKQLQSRSTK